MRNCITFAVLLWLRRRRAGDRHCYLAWRASYFGRFPHVQFVSGDRRHWIGLAATLEHRAVTLGMSDWNPRKYLRVLNFPGRVEWGNPKGGNVRR